MRTFHAGPGAKCPDYIPGAYATPAGDATALSRRTRQCHRDNDLLIATMVSLRDDPLTRATPSERPGEIVSLSAPSCGVAGEPDG